MQWLEVVAPSTAAPAATDGGVDRNWLRLTHPVDCGSRHTNGSHAPYTIASLPS